MRIAAILGGGDWTDASVDHLILPDGMDVDAERTQWRAWYNDEYCPQLRAGRKPKYMGLCEWMISHGARLASEDEVEIHGDY